jgi:hypothetical protein
MVLEIQLSHEEEVALLNAVVLCKRIGNVGGCKLATVANIAAKKLDDVLQEAKAEQIKNPPF